MSTFHHAYNGIPTHRSGDSFFADGSAPCLDHLDLDSYSGTLKLTIETKTPLITSSRDELVGSSSPPLVETLREQPVMQKRSFPQLHSKESYLPPMRQ